MLKDSPDKNKTILTSVDIFSNNVNTKIARAGDTIILTFTANDEIKEPVVKILDHETKVKGEKLGPYTAEYKITPKDSIGNVAFTIDYKDTDGQECSQVTATTTKGKVIVYPALNTVYVAGITLFVSLLIVGYVVIFPRPQGNQPETMREINTYASGDNFHNSEPVYDSVKVLRSQGKVNEAASLLEAVAVKYATSTRERNIMDLDVALLLSSGDKPLEGTVRLKQIIIQPKIYVELTRALAVEGLVRQYLAFHDLTIRKEIFNGVPFDSILSNNDGNYGKAYMGLLLYGMSIQPTPIAALRLAEKKAYALMNNVVATSTRGPMKNEIDEFIAKGEEQKKNIENLSSYKSYLSEYYSVLGGVYLYLFAAGYDEYKELADKAYRDALVLSDGSLKVFVLFHYGAFLSFTDPKNPQIESIATQLVNTPALTRTVFDKFVKNSLALKEKDPGYRWITVFSKHSPTFNTYVKSIK